MYIFNVVIADDEEIIRNGIFGELSLEYSNIVISGVYSNGTDVINHLVKNEVDILISDIRMPGATGIDIAEFIKEKGLLTKMIVITGYRDFEYAKKLLDYQVYSLIMKPIDIELLIETVGKMMTEIYQHQDKIADETKQLLFLHDLKRQNLASVVFGEKTPEEIVSKQYGSDYTNDFYSSCCALIHILPDQPEELDEKKFNKIMWQDMGENQTEAYEAYSLSGNPFKGTFLLIMKVTDKEDPDRIARHFAETLCRDIRTAMMVNCTYSFAVYSSVAEIQILNGNDFADIYNDYISYNDVQGRKDYLQTVIAGYSFKRLFDVVSDLVERVHEKYNIDFSSQRQRLLVAVTKEEVIGILYEIDNLIDEYNSFDSSTIISKIVKYVNEHIGGEITLDTISDKFNLSKSHISRLFKKKLGENFVDYLNRLRIHKAKELIKENKYNISEISYMVGYTNPRYFGQVFKSETGLTPSQYFISNIK